MTAFSIVVLVSFLALLTVADLLPLFARPQALRDHRSQPWRAVINRRATPGDG